MLTNKMPFFKHPLRIDYFGRHVYDASNNMIFSFESCRSGYIIQQNKKIVEILNSSNCKKIICTRLSINKLNQQQILKSKKPSIMMKSRHYLENRFLDASTITYVTKNFQYWLIHKITSNLDIEFIYVENITNFKNI